MIAFIGKILSSKPLQLGFILFMLLFSIYSLSFRGNTLSIDEEYIIDGTESLVNRGNTYLNYHFDFNTSANLKKNGEPWPSARQEIVIFMALTPLYWLTLISPLPTIFPTILFFNVFVTAITATSIYALALRRGQDVYIAWWGALLFALGTIAWFYSRQLFREPLLGLWLLWVFWLAERIRFQLNDSKLPWRNILVLGVVFTIALLTKVVTILLLPSVLLMLAPSRKILLTNKKQMRILAGAGLVGTLAIVGLFVTEVGGPRFSTSNFGKPDLEYIFESIIGYQISFGRSIWLYSPVLLLGFYGLRKRPRISFIMLLNIFIFSAWYGYGLEYDWIGGWGWGTRYMLPLIPTMILYWVIPSLDQLLINPRGKLTVAVFALLGVGIQLLGMSVQLSNYYAEVFLAGKYFDYDRFNPEKTHWLGLNWEFRWSPIYYHIDRLDLSNLDFAWFFADSIRYPLGSIFLMIGLSLVGGWIVLRPDPSRRLFGGISLCLVALIPITIVSTAHSLRNDPRNVLDRPGMVELVRRLNKEVTPNEIIFVESSHLKLLFANYFKTRATVAILDDSPLILTDEAEVTRAERDKSRNIIQAIEWSAEHYDSFWLVTRTSPFDGLILRTTEQFLIQNFYPVKQIIISDRSRAIHFLARPDNTQTTTMNINFDKRLLLRDVVLTDFDTLEPGDSLAITLSWQPYGFVMQDYNVGVYLLGPQGFVETQHDGPPQGGFTSTSRWSPVEIYLDNHGLILPGDLEAGDYQLALAVYDWRTGQRLPVYDSTGQSLGDLLTLAKIRVQ